MTKKLTHNFHNIDFKKGSNMALIAVFFSVLFTIFATFICEIYFINHSKVNAQIMNDIASDAVAVKMLIVNEDIQKKWEEENEKINFDELSEAQAKIINKARKEKLRKKMVEEAEKTTQKVLELNQAKTQYAYNYQASLNTKKLTKKNQAKIDLSTQTRSTFMNTKKSGFDFTRPSAPNSDTYIIKTTATTEFGNWRQEMIRWLKASMPYATYGNDRPPLYTSNGYSKVSDCSGVMWQAYMHVGLRNVPGCWSSNDVCGTYFNKISYSELKPGDLLAAPWGSFPGTSMGHVVMYMGDNQIIQMGGGSDYINIASAIGFMHSPYHAYRIKPEYEPTGAFQIVKTYGITPTEPIKGLKVKGTKSVPHNIQTGLTANSTYYTHINWGWDQRKLYNLWKKQGKKEWHGVAAVNGLPLVAVTTKFGYTGDYITIHLENGKQINAIIGDSKGDDAGSVFGHFLGGRVDVIEWESIDSNGAKKLKNYLRSSGLWGVKVAKITTYKGNVLNCN